MKSFAFFLAVAVVGWLATSGLQSVSAGTAECFDAAQDAVRNDDLNDAVNTVLQACTEQVNTNTTTICAEVIAIAKAMFASNSDLEQAAQLIQIGCGTAGSTDNGVCHYLIPGNPGSGSVLCAHVWSGHWTVACGTKYTGDCEWTCPCTPDEGCGKVGNDAQGKPIEPTGQTCVDISQGFGASSDWSSGYVHGDGDFVGSTGTLDFQAGQSVRQSVDDHYAWHVTGARRTHQISGSAFTTGLVFQDAIPRIAATDTFVP